MEPVPKSRNGNRSASVVKSQHVFDSSLKKTTERLVKLMEKTGYQLVQINGQRRYGGPPPKWEGPPPPRGSEVFVGKIPRDCFEDELVPTFEVVGEIYELRLMMDFSGSNRGFGFVMYSSPEIADLAVKKLNNYEIREGWRIGVAKSANNCRLYIWGLPTDKNITDIRSVLCRLTEGLSDLWLYKSTDCGPDNTVHPQTSGQYALVEYESHHAAAMARRRLIPDRVQLWGREIIVEWATPHISMKHQQACEGLDRMNQEIPTSQQKNNQIQQNSANNGTISSQSSDTWCLERAIDEFIYDNSCTGPIPLSCTQHTDNPIQLVESVRPNANNISPDIQIADSASTKNYRGNSKPLVAADVNRELVPSGAEVTSTMENGRRITNYSVQLVKQHTVYQQWKGNYIRGNASGSGNNSDTVFGMQNTQLPNYSGIDYRPQRQVCLNGVAQTEMLSSDYIETNKDELNTKMPLCGTAGLTKFSYDQILRNFNKLKFGRAVKGRVPMTSGIKTELASTGNQNFSPEEYVGSSKPVENSASPNDKTGINVRVGGKQKLSLGKCLPNIRCGPASDVNSSSCASGNAETDANDHSHVFNPAPGGPVYVRERNDIVSDGDKMNHAAYSFWKIL